MLKQYRLSKLWLVRLAQLILKGNVIVMIKQKAQSSHLSGEMLRLGFLQRSFPHLCYLRADGSWRHTQLGQQWPEPGVLQEEESCSSMAIRRCFLSIGRDNIF